MRPNEIVAASEQLQLATNAVLGSTQSVVLRWRHAMALRIVKFRRSTYAVLIVRESSERYKASSRCHCGPMISFLSVQTTRPLRNPFLTCTYTQDAQNVLFTTSLLYLNASVATSTLGPICRQRRLSESQVRSHVSGCSSERRRAPKTPANCRNQAARKLSLSLQLYSR